MQNARTDTITLLASGTAVSREYKSKCEANNGELNNAQRESALLSRSKRGKESALLEWSLGELKSTRDSRRTVLTSDLDDLVKWNLSIIPIRDSFTIELDSTALHIDAQQQQMQLRLIIINIEVVNNPSCTILDDWLDAFESAECA
jgi:hypothetical protein